MIKTAHVLGYLADIWQTDLTQNSPYLLVLACF